MADIRNVRDMNGLITYFSENLGWSIDLDDFDDIEDISYDFSAADIGLKEEAFARKRSGEGNVIGIPVKKRRHCG